MLIEYHLFWTHEYNKESLFMLLTPAIPSCLRAFVVKSVTVPEE